MSGIAGIFDPGGKPYREEALRLPGALRHRGEAGECTASLPGLCIVHTSGTKEQLQPFIRRIGKYSYICAADGHIQNAPALRKQLEARNHVFLTDSDAELIVIAYFEWGTSCCDRFEGSFAVALYDERERLILLFRDALGVRPMYYYRSKSALVFGSEIKALLASGIVPARMDREGLMTLFALCPAMPPGKTLFCGIRELRPGECLAMRPTGVSTYKYFRLCPGQHYDDPPATAYRVRELVSSSLTACLPESGPCAAFLSGGLDSSILCALAAGELAQRGVTLQTFSIHYEENEKYFQKNYFQPGTDDEYIELMHRSINCEHHRIVLSPQEVADTLRAAMHARDMPGMADIDSSLLLACKSVAPHAPVVLSGECADELFCGYPWFSRSDLINGSCFPWSGSLVLRRSLLSRAFDSLPIEEFARAHWQWARSGIPSPGGESDDERERREVYCANLDWFGTTLLTRKDRMSAAAGVRAMLPFADKRIAQYAFNIPWDIKNLHGREKGILREAFSDFLPTEVCLRKKTPYPKTLHPQYMQIVSDRLSLILADPASRLNDIISKKNAEALLYGSESAHTPWFGQLMTRPQLIAFLIQVEAWLNDYHITLDL